MSLCQAYRLCARPPCPRLQAGSPVALSPEPARCTFGLHAQTHGPAMVLGRARVPALAEQLAASRGAPQITGPAGPQLSGSSGATGARPPHAISPGSPAGSTGEASAEVLGTAGPAGETAFPQSLP